MTPPPVRRRCMSCGTLGPVGDVDGRPAACPGCGRPPSFGEHLNWWAGRHWALSLALGGAAIILLLLLLQARG